MIDCRLILDPPADGAWNMAVDEVLWDWAGRTGIWCLRMYRWAEPTLSLGYFQSYDDRQGHEPSRSCAVVRRISGGGAIVHDAELTYSLAVPVGCSVAHLCGHNMDPAHKVSRIGGCAENVPHKWLYQIVHAAIIDLLATFGVMASTQTAEPLPRAHPSPFLCFQRRSPGDVLVGSVKLAGSAQRRNHASVLQHGSLLLARSPAAPELPGLKELTGRDFAVEDVLEGWLPRLSERLQLRWNREALSQTERDRAALLVAGKHAADGWVYLRGRQAIQAPIDTPPPAG